MELFILVNEPKLGENAQIWSIRILQVHSKPLSFSSSVYSSKLCTGLSGLTGGQADERTDRRTDGRFYWYLKS